MATENIANPLVVVQFLPDRSPVISSRDMAAHFQKKHKHILEEIKRTQTITTKEFSEPNSRPSALHEDMLTALALSPDEKLLLQKVAGYRRRGLTQAEIAKLSDAYRIQVGQMTARAKKLGLLPPAGEKPGRRKG